MNTKADRFSSEVRERTQMDRDGQRWKSLGVAHKTLVDTQSVLANVRLTAYFTTVQ